MLSDNKIVACQHWWNGTAWVESTASGGGSGSTQVSISSVAGRVDVGDMSTLVAPTVGSSGLIVRLASPLTDSTNNAIRVFQVASSGGASSTEVTVRQSTIGDLQAVVTPAAGSTWNVRPLQSSAGDLQMTATPAAGSTFNVRPLQSSAGDLQMTATPAAGSTWNVRALQSSAADFNVSAVQGSTVWFVQVSSVAGRVLVDQNSTTWFTQAAIRDSSGVAFNGVTTRPTTNAQGLSVRAVLNDLQSTAFSTIGNGSTSSTIVSSVASQRVKVYAYSITSTAQAVNTLTFASSLANLIWTVQMQSLSSGIAGANLAVTPPAWLFATEAASPLVFKITGTTGTYHLSVSYFVEA